MTQANEKQSKTIIKERRQHRDLLQQQFLNAHKDNKRLDNPFMTLKDKQRLAEDKAKREQLLIINREKELKEMEEMEKQKKQDDLKQYFKDLESNK